MYRSSSLRSTLNTSYIRGLGMCKVCTEAVVFHSSTLLSFYSSILLLFRSVALLCCCSSILLARRNLASSSFSIDRLTSADLGWPRLTSADVGWPRLTSADLDRRKFAHTTSWHNAKYPNPMKLSCNSYLYLLALLQNENMKQQTNCIRTYIYIYHICLYNHMCIYWILPLSSTDAHAQVPKISLEHIQVLDIGSKFQVLKQVRVCWAKFVASTKTNGWYWYLS